MGVHGGSFTAAHSITVGQHGMGVLEIGPTGTLHAASLVLADNAYTASGEHAATLKFTFGSDGVGVATVTNLVVAEGSALVVDMRGYDFAGAGPGTVTLLRAANVEGAFERSNMQLLLPGGTAARNVEIVCSSGGIEVKISRGTVLLVR